MTISTQSTDSSRLPIGPESVGKRTTKNAQPIGRKEGGKEVKWNARLEKKKSLMSITFILHFGHSLLS